MNSVPITNVPLCIVYETVILKLRSTAFVSVKNGLAIVNHLNATVARTQFPKRNGKIPRKQVRGDMCDTKIKYKFNNQFCAEPDIN